MGKVDIKKLFEGKQKEMLLKFDLTDNFTHPTDKGDATEEEWRDWFNEYFPKRYKAEKACVIDSDGNVSDQIDIVIYDTHFTL